MKRLFFLLLLFSCVLSAQSSQETANAPKLSYSKVTDHSVTVSWPGLENKTEGTLFLSWEHSDGESGGISIFFPERATSFTFDDFPAGTNIHFTAFMSEGPNSRETLQGITCATSNLDTGDGSTFSSNH